MTTTILDKQFFALNSYFGDFLNGSKKSKVQFTFPNLVAKKDGVMQLRIGVDNAVFPCSFYVVNDSNNLVCFWDDYSDTQYNLSIPVGNYTAKELIAQLQTLYTHWTWTISDITGKFTIFNEYRITFTTNTTAWQILGLEEGVETTLEVTSPSYTCPYQCNLFGPTRISVCAPQIPCPNSDMTGKGFLMNVPANVAPYEMIVYENPDSHGCILPIDFSTDTIELHIMDEKGNMLDFQNQDWSIVLFVEYTMEGGADDRIWSLTDLVKSYETQVIQAIEQKKHKAEPTHHHHYNTRKKHTKDGSKKTKSG
jgi:hypothetical protein